MVNTGGISGTLSGGSALSASIRSGAGGTSNYENLTNKPQINGVELLGDKSLEDLGIENNMQPDWEQADDSQGDYIKNKPTLGTASALDVPESGDAAEDEVVKGDDSRLTNSRPASDVYSWAKASTKPSYTKSDVGLGNVDNTSDTTKKTSFTGSIASGNAGFVTGGDAYTALGNKVDKVSGKGLSANDYDNTDKGKVGKIGTTDISGIADGTLTGAVSALANTVVGSFTYNGSTGHLSFQPYSGSPYTFTLTNGHLLIS